MNSLWNATQSLPSFPALEGHRKTDVLIIGGGITGILCAHFLQEAGVDYTLVEANRICRGVTGNTTAKITAQHGLIYHKLIRRFGAERARMYLEANRAALEQYRLLCADIDCDFEEKDSFVYSIDAPVKLEQELKALDRLGLTGDLMDKAPLPFHIAGTVKFPRQGQFHPLKFLSSIAKGLNIYENTRVLSFDGRNMITDQGVITAETTIVATHFPLFSRHGAYFLKLYQHRSHVLALEGGPNVDGMYADEADDGLSFRNYRGMLLLGGGGRRTGKPGEGWAEPAGFSRLHYPNAREIFCWAAQDCISLDGVPYIGRYARNTPNLYVATGFNKWGMTSSMAAAMMLKDMVQGKESPFAPVFSPSRTVLRPQLAVNGAESVIHLLTPTRPRCPHMGCALKWNPQEHSWDCPCHGSRFSEEGKVLDNPANGDLKRR